MWWTAISTSPLPPAPPAPVRVFPLPAGRPEAPLPDGGFVLASPMAGWRAKQWPLENYLALAGLLLRECNSAGAQRSPGSW